MEYFPDKEYSGKNFVVSKKSVSLHSNSMNFELLF